MVKTTKKELYEHIQRYVREVMTNRLRQAGFSSYCGEDIHWFRLVNDEVIHAVYFVTDYAGFPVMLEIGYGCHPLFIPPVLSKSPYMRSMPGYEQMSHMIPELVPGSMPMGVQRSLIHGSVNGIYRVPDVMVSYPLDDHRGLNILEQVLSVMEDITTPSACLELHKNWRAKEIENDSWLTMTPYFVDEVLYSETQSLYPYCRSYVEGKLLWLDSVNRNGRLARKMDREELEHLGLLKKVFDEGRYEEYREKLRERSYKNLLLLEKHTDIGTDHQIHL